MVAEKGTVLEDVDDLGVGQPDRIIERGYYGRALREGQVRPSPPRGSRRVDTPLWVLNVVLWLLLGGFVAWRLYAVYMVGGT